MSQTHEENPEQNFERLIEKVRRTLEEGRRRVLDVLLLGRTGVGKSTTINSLLDRKKAKEGDSEPTTQKVEPYDLEINGIHVRIWDTPGLCDDLQEAGNDQHYLEQVCAALKEKGVDSVWYVTKLNDTRVRSDEKQSIKVISEVLGKQIWERAVIVFTHADMVGCAHYAEALQTWGEKIRQEIGKRAGDRIATQVPAVAVDNTCPTTPDGEPWLGELFTKVFTRLPEEAVAPFLLAMADSIVAPQAAEGTDHGGVPNQPRIVLNARQDEEVRKKMNSAGLVGPGVVLGGSIGFAVGGPMGAGVGGVAGAVVGWILSRFFRVKNDS